MKKFLFFLIFFLCIDKVCGMEDSFLPKGSSYPNSPSKTRMRRSKSLGELLSNEQDLDWLAHYKEVGKGNKRGNEHNAPGRCHNLKTAQEDCRILTTYLCWLKNGIMMLNNNAMRLAFYNAEKRRRDQEELVRLERIKLLHKNDAWFTKFNRRLQTGTLTQQDFFVTTGFSLFAGAWLFKFYQNKK